MILIKGQALLSLMTCVVLAGCAGQSTVKPIAQQTDTLYVNADGTMEFRNRKYARENVIIYPDGTGGERAAVKMYVPLHPDYYRDSIVVVRREPENTTNTNSN
ncbi:MAG: hypothetical protein O6928_10040 [Gammaproteobacteria bacterium]|nr:hypothetical protein [Gammaproteobacteria bacterium]